MALREEIDRQGNWLFRNRGLFPLILLPFAVAAMYTSAAEIIADPRRIAFELVCAAIAFAGLVFRAIVIATTGTGTSGRNTKKQVAVRLNQTGLYSVMRHPLYFGNFISFLGIILFMQVWWFIFFACIAFWIYYERIMFAEEEFLRKIHGEAFLAWADRTPLIFPSFKNFKPVEMEFSVKNIVQREYHGVLVLSVVFFGLHHLMWSVGRWKIVLDMEWLAGLGVIVVLYLFIRFLKKRTRFFEDPAR